MTSRAVSTASADGTRMWTDVQNPTHEVQSFISRVFIFLIFTFVVGSTFCVELLSTFIDFGTLTH